MLFAIIYRVMRLLRRDVHVSRLPPGYFVPIELAGGTDDRPRLRIVD